MSQIEGWKAVQVQGTLEAEMLSEALENADIPCRVSKDWFGAAYGIAGLNTVGHRGKVLVPEERFEEALALAKEIFGDSEIS
ncbi:MAG TPA: DUF2007 domain-containing protein [Calditrichia bacterium]|nr:DUF2007 domain-containing protein [Calditrichota bacterium]HQU72082.1 DUF2007 domain-containing protein [Calditrichia bacterium]HQV30243.1 DUF2007 domain-containing protein [Calditrichia bacterium]